MPDEMAADHLGASISVGKKPNEARRRKQNRHGMYGDNEKIKRL